MIACAYCGDPKPSAPVTPGPRFVEALPWHSYPELNGYDCVTWLCKECHLATIALIEVLWELPTWEETT